MADIKFLYVRDSVCPQQVLTVARRIVGDVVEVTFCCNRAELSDVAYKRDNYVPRWVVLDRFEKARARTITVARFTHADRILTLPYRKGQVISDILNFFAAGGHGQKDLIKPTVARLALRALTSPEYRKRNKARASVSSQPSEPTNSEPR